MTTADIQFTPIGMLHTDLVDLDQAPKNFDESNFRGIIEIEPRFQEAMHGIVPGSRIVVLFFLHRARRDILKVYPRGDRSRPLTGVFATRSPVRPNPIAVSELRVEAVDGCRITVFGVDVIDGTPVLDIKKALSPA